MLARRQFLGLGAGGALLGTARRAGAWTASAPASMREPGAPFTAYGVPSEWEQEVVRLPTANLDVPGNGASWCPLHRLEGIITPNGLHYERHHNGVPRIDPATHELLVHGRVRRALSFRVQELLRYPLRSRICFLECGGNSNAGWHRQPIQAPAGHVHGLLSCSEWTGVPLSAVLAEAEPRTDADWLIAEGADAFAMHVSIPMRKALEDGLLALYQNGERLRPENGYPLRLILPGWEGVTNVKWLRRLRVVDRPVMARNDTYSYTDLLPSGKARQFSHTMDVKSLLLQPSAGMRLPGPGWYLLSGLAWSGRGRIRGVELSTDGGRHWQAAELEQPVLSKCLTRFRLPWQWDGAATVLMSRATDISGAVQPAREQLVAARGRHGYFHYHAIVSWAVGREGEVRHVYGTGSGDSHDSNAPADIDSGWF